ncbi:MAG TPA: dihydrofolate reductase [Chitinophagaceae bacterium]|nr:dihydrofolate reductase [Chitinophagaceae bacterium]
MIISLVVAAAENNAIGLNRQLPWTLPNDMRFFKNITWGMVVIMGRKTFESLGKPLRGRKNIVVTRQQDWHPPGVTVTASLDQALERARSMEFREAFVIGGGELYRQALPRAQRIYLTRVHASPQGDTFFPDLDPGTWKMVSHRDYPADDRHAVAYSFQLWSARGPQGLPDSPPVQPS